jgi:hypothetical protein
MRKLVKKAIASLPQDTLERALALSVLAHRYGNLGDTKVYPRREDLWLDVLKRQEDKSLTYLEFGVFEGYSIKFIAENYPELNSSFYGFDSFVGLPENWFATMEKGMFDVGGRAPSIDDSRVTFVKGWFQNSLPPFLKEVAFADKLVVHLDADLYSSTLFVLMQLDAFKRPYHAIFDEFTGQETRALHNYQQASGAKVEFIGKVMNYGYPEQVSCKIIPCDTYTV